MENVSPISDPEIRDELKFTRRWYDLGIVDDAWVALAVREYRQSDDHGDEHYRYGSFMAYFRRRKHALLAGECRALFELAANDPDSEMGTSMILEIVHAPGCPDDVVDAAAAHPPSARYVPRNWREVWRPPLDPKARRRKLQGLVAEGYYRTHGFREDGRRRKDQTVYKEMRGLFGINYARFREIRNATDRSAR